MRLVPPGTSYLSILNTTSLRLDQQDVVRLSLTSLAHYGAVSIAGCSTAFTVAANMLTIFILVRHRQLHSSISNLYILSLSFADLLIGLVVMLLMAVHLFVYRLRWFYGPTWLCDVWQLSDIIFSTTSLYSICAIALDRVWNLEKPLRVLKRNRKIAKRLIFAIWILPVITWTPVYFVLTNRVRARGICAFSRAAADVHATCCFTVWSNHYVLPIVAVPLLYIPAVVLVAMFVRISIVVHRHLKFLREHSCKAKKSVVSIGNEAAPASSSNSLGKSPEGTPLRTPELTRRMTDISINTTTIGSSSTAIRNTRCSSPRLAKLEWNLAPLSEERSSGRDRSHSEQIQIPAREMRRLEKVAANTKLSRMQAAMPALTRKHSVQSKELLSVQRGDVMYRNNNSFPESPPSQRINQVRSWGSFDTSSVCNGTQRRLSRISSASRVGSFRFSVIAIPGNLTDLLHKDGLARQMRAAKAVSLILSSFLICWLPFLVFWPIKVFCSECIPENVYLASIWLNYLCSTVNPLLYTLSSPRVRGVVRNYLTCQALRSPRKPSAYRSATIV